MYILGISDSLHDRSVCLLENGEIRIAIEEERLTRVKHGFQYDEANYTIEKDGAYIQHLLSTVLSSKKRASQIEMCIEYCLKNSGVAFEEIRDSIYISSLFTPPAIKGTRKVPHHLAHAASTFYPSQFEEAAILIVDGYGDSSADGSETISYGSGKENEISIFQKIQGISDLSSSLRASGATDTIIAMQNSIGAFYKNASVVLDMGAMGEGKTMGLASYGTDDPLVPRIEDWIHFGEHGALKIDNYQIYQVLRQYQSKYLHPILLSEQDRFQSAANLAYKIQHLTEQMVIFLARYLYSATRSKNLCLAGGVALNSVANHKILEQTPFEHLFIHPAAGDNGVSFGAAFWGYYGDRKHKRTPEKRQSLFSPYLGKTYSDVEILKSYQKYAPILSCTKLSDDTLYQKASQFIATGKIVGWFQDGSEIGPRALGNRSILADPRQARNRDILNLRVKHREWFRPFAPIILEEYAKEYFHISEPSPYMLIVSHVRDEKKEEIPAVTHVDGSARIQTLSAESNLKMHKLLTSFKQITGVPVLLNTSFNDRGEPIVETPEEALAFFASADMDALFIHQYLIEKIATPQIQIAEQNQEAVDHLALLNTR